MRDGRNPPHGRRVGFFVAVLAVSLAAVACSGVDDAEPSPATAEPRTTALATSIPEPATVPSVVATTPAVDDPPWASLLDLPFDEFVEVSYGEWLKRHPEFLTSLGIAGDYGLRNDRLDDLSPEYLRETQDLEVETLEALRRYDYEALTSDQQLTFDIYEWHLSHLIDGHRWMYHDYPVHHFVNSYNDQLIRGLVEEHPLDDVGDAEDYVAKLSQIAAQVGQLIEGLEIRRELGIHPPDFILRMTISRLKGDLNSNSPRAETVDAKRLELYTAFRDKLSALAAVDAGDRERLLAEALEQVRTSFVPAWIALIEHLESLSDVVTAEPGLHRLPDGEDYYEWVLRDQTSTGLSATEIHDVGLREIERVTAEMRIVFASMGYPADAPLGELRGRAAREGGFLSGVGTAGAAEVIAEYESLIAEAERVSDPVFNSAPTAEVIVVPEQLGRGGFYVPASADGSRPGAFHAGVAGSSIARYVMPTITYHEAVPGHHFQIALAQELDLPGVRRFTHYNAFVEGWALYAERLAYELGLYADDPFGDIGRLELELLRAVRLVVDTGIHAFGWTREEARSFIETAMGDSSWSHEVERYVVLPGQATGYMVGMLRILALRDDLQSAHGAAFDLAAFHDLVIGGGSLPLDILDRVVIAAASR